MDRDIKFGFWNYVESGVYSADAVLDWKDMHCNLPMSFTYDCKKHNKQDMLATFFWRYKLLYLVAKEYDTDFVIVLN